MKKQLTKMEEFEFTVEDAKRHFGMWDDCDPVVWALLRCVQAQNDFAHAMDVASDRMVEEAIKERAKAISDLQAALKEEPRGYQ